MPKFKKLLKLANHYSTLMMKYYFYMNRPNLLLKAKKLNQFKKPFRKNNQFNKLKLNSHLNRHNKLNRHNSQNNNNKFKNKKYKPQKSLFPVTKE